MTSRQLIQDLREASSTERAKINQWFFKTGPGEYGEGDQFWGIRVPDIRKLIKPYTGLSPKAAHPLLRSPIHEQRLAALFLLVAQFQKGTKKTQQEIYRFYMKNLKYVNNWDLVDLSAWQIVGGYLFEKSRKPLYVLAKSPNLWKRRVAIIATFYDIKQHEFYETLKIAKMLVGDHEDLIHKAVGWMLREVGKRAVKVEEGFLKQHYTTMPRTMLRYAIERFPEGKRHRYLHGKA